MKYIEITLANNIIHISGVQLYNMTPVYSMCGPHLKSSLLLKGLFTSECGSVIQTVF